MAEYIGIAWALVFRLVWIVEAWLGACIAKAAFERLVAPWLG